MQKSSKCVKMAVFRPPKFLKLISRKIWMIEKSWNFYTVLWCFVRFHVIFFVQRSRKLEFLYFHVIFPPWCIWKYFLDLFSHFQEKSFLNRNLMKFDHFLMHFFLFFFISRAVHFIESWIFKVHLSMAFLFLILTLRSQKLKYELEFQYE